MTEEIDSILVFEYFTASGEKDKCIISEAEELIFALLNDLSDFKIDLVINKSYENIAQDYDNVNAILIDENIIDWLKDNVGNFKRLFSSQLKTITIYIISLKYWKKTMLRLTPQHQRHVS